MAKRVRTVVTYIDDLTGEELPEGDGQTVVYSIDGKHYEIDLSNQTADEFRMLLQPIIEKSRKAGAPLPKPKGIPSRGPRALPASSTGQEGAHMAQSKRAGWILRRDIRQWARDNGYDQGNVGRIKEDVAAGWNAAHPDRPFIEGL